jgi:hypothetical protein
VSFTDQIFNAAGQPATVRVGVVTSTSPFEVTVQGAVFTGLGLLNVAAPPGLGAVVLLLGQAVKGAKSSGSSWIVLGEIIAA